VAADPASLFLFNRPTRAAKLADDLTGRGPFHYGSGLFLAAPRRTGKSTFLRFDLIPALTKRSVLPIYVDLWEDRQRDPASLLWDAVKARLKKLEGLGAKTLRKSGLAKLTIGPATFEIDKMGQPGGSTLTEALKAIVARTERPLALIVDEAQQALASDAGIDAMFALKAARDALGQGSGAGQTAPPILVFTGSHRDKLSSFVLKRDQPFFGAEIEDFPKLGRDFSDAYTRWINERLARKNRFDEDDVWEAFQILGHRPEMLQKILKDTALGPSKSAGLKAELADGARALRERVWEDYDSQVASLTPVQKAVLGRLIEKGSGFVPFNEESRAAYAQAVGETVTPSEAQKALNALRQANIVWRNARGGYTLEDQDMADWFRARYPPATSPPA